MRLAKRSILIFIVVLSCVGCDQASKTIARSILVEKGMVSVMHDTLRFQLALNKGAFMSLGAHLPESLKYWILSIGVGGLLIGLLVYALLNNRVNPYALFSLSLIIGGGFGNLIDRLVLNGKVVDFMNVGIGYVRTGIFNFADIAITTGLIMLLAASLRGQNKAV